MKPPTPRLPRLTRLTSAAWQEQYGYFTCATPWAFDLCLAATRIDLVSLCCGAWYACTPGDGARLAVCMHCYSTLGLPAMDEWDDVKCKGEDGTEWLERLIGSSADVLTAAVLASEVMDDFAALRAEAVRTGWWDS